MSSGDLSGRRPEGAALAYHIELRQFPHNLCRFNLGEDELYATIAVPWAGERWIELGERKWSPHQAKLTVLQGPHLPVAQLSMGRGWRNAQREGHDVTERVLAAARARAEGAMQTRAPLPAEGSPRFRPAPASAADAAQADVAQAPDEKLLADSLGLELLTRLAAGPVPLRRAWELALAHHPDRSASKCLALCERALASLLASGLIALLLDGGTGDAPRQLDEGETQAVLRSVEPWTAESVRIARR
jgi:hypothetical protein